MRKVPTGICLVLLSVMTSMLIGPASAAGPPYDASSGLTSTSGVSGSPDCTRPSSYVSSVRDTGKFYARWTCGTNVIGPAKTQGEGWMYAWRTTNRQGSWSIKVTANFATVSFGSAGSNPHSSAEIWLRVWDTVSGQVLRDKQIWKCELGQSCPQTGQTVPFEEFVYFGSGTRTIQIHLRLRVYSDMSGWAGYAEFTSTVDINITDITLRFRWNPWQ